MEAIEVNNLTRVFRRQRRKSGLAGAFKGLFHREYDEVRAVDDISFQIDAGEVVGYIGPNGAGKSTTVKMLVGILVPTSGSVVVGGMIPHDNRVANARRIGVVFGQRTQLWWDIPVAETFNLLRYMYDIPLDRYRENIKRFSEVLGVDEFMNVSVRQLSLGQRMRADLCASLLHDPDYIYLDEPTIGLDVVVKERIRQFIIEINSRYGKTVLLTTHDVSDIEKLCKRVIVIDHGHIMYDGNLQVLRDRYGSEEVLTVEFADHVPVREEIALPGVDNVEIDGVKAMMTYDRRNVSSSTILQHIMRRHTVTDFVVRDVEIESVIRTMYADLESQR